MNLAAEIEDKIESAKSILGAAVDAAMPSAHHFARLLDDAMFSRGPVAVLSVGKAAMSMTKVVEDLVPVSEAFVTVPESYLSENRIVLSTTRTLLCAGDHPFPGDGSKRAAEAAMTWLRALPDDIPVVVLISGGGSALWGKPIDGVSDHCYRDLVQAMILSGLDIHEINLIRRHLNVFGGGGLIPYLDGHPILAFVISDVSGDDVGMVSSGPLSPPREQEVRQLNDSLTTLTDQGRIDNRVAHTLLESAMSKHERNIPPIQIWKIIDNSMAMAGASRRAEALGYRVTKANALMKGDAADMGRAIVHRMERLQDGTPRCVIFGGETTVDVSGEGKGGRNQELVLAAAIELKNIGLSATVASIGTDGVDGPTDAAGAVANEQSVVQSARRGLDAITCLRNNDSYTFFAGTKNHILSGPTHTNVMDIAIGLI